MRIENCKECYFNEYDKCKLNPPIIIVTGFDGDTRQVYPEVSSKDWCGQFVHYRDNTQKITQPNPQEEMDELLSLSFGGVNV